MAKLGMKMTTPMKSKLPPHLLRLWVEPKPKKKSQRKKENGLSVIETPDGSIDSVDGSGSWNEKDTTKKDTTTSGNNSDEDILVDDKVWGDVN